MYNFVVVVDFFVCFLFHFLEDHEKKKRKKNKMSNFMLGVRLIFSFFKCFEL